MSDICVFEWRYSSRDMRKIFSRHNIIRRYIDVEIALFKALTEIGIAPRECYDEILRCLENIDPEEIYEYEKRVGHEINALISIAERKCGSCGRFIHFGASSGDIIDTAHALIMREALSVVRYKLRRAIERLIDLSLAHRDLIMIGRTHGQHAEPITLGFKLANYVYELTRSYERLCESLKRVVRGKISGAVGMMSCWGEKSLLVEKIFSSHLNLETHMISTQISPRDGYAEIASVLAILASQLDRFALEIRELSRTEIREIYEISERIDSSSMPHKRNPATAERISGLARVVRSLVQAFLENIVVMHERDLSNSSAERVLIPHLFLAIDQMLEDTLKLFDRIEIDKRSIERNLGLTRGVIFAERILLKLVERGLSREEALNRLRILTDKSLREERSFIEVLLEDDLIRRYLSEEEIRRLTEIESQLGPYQELIDRVIRYSREILTKC